MAFTDMPAEVLDCTAQIVSAHVARNAVPISDVPDVIVKVYQALMELNGTVAPRQAANLAPAVPVKKSVFPDYIVCLEDGKKLKMLRRHLKTVYGMTPDQYRQRWGLPSSYPMVAPSYAERRSTLAKAIGLGNGRRRETMGAAASDIESEPDLIDEDDESAVEDVAAADDVVEAVAAELVSPRAVAPMPATPRASRAEPPVVDEEPDREEDSERAMTIESVFANFPGASAAMSDREGGDAKVEKEPADGAKSGRRKRFAQQSARQMPAARSTNRR